jgi:YHS domain-containing protein
MRTIIILLLVTVALAILRTLVSDVGKAVSKAMKGGSRARPREADAPQSAGKLAKDPETGAYVDEATAVTATIGGRLYYFESEQSRERYLRRRA